MTHLTPAYDFLQNITESRRVPGAALLVARRGQPTTVHAFGKTGPIPESLPMQSDTVFLVASVTKPVTVAAVMLLVERGELLLSDPVASIIPEFGNRGKNAICVRHLMTHTSGLPDMLPENERLRRQHAPLSEFVRRIYEVEPRFAPDTNIQYQSCGIAILGEIVERVAGIPLPQFLEQEFFHPLEMHDTSLGVGKLEISRIASVNVGKVMGQTDWHWNTPYWRNFAAPWGGMFSTVTDTYRFCRMFLNGGELDGVRVLGSATVAAMTRDQTSSIPTIPAEARHGQAWGFGWRLQPASGWSYFGDLISPGSYGHGGATGTVVWVDLIREIICVLFTNQPSASSEGILGRCSNLVAASVV